MAEKENLQDAYLEKEGYYYQFTRTDLIDLLPKKKVFKNVLEIGASGGYTLLYLKLNGIAEKVTGIELFKLDGTEQNNPIIDKFILGNIEQMDADTFSGEFFDLVICGDVLEHLADPWSTVDKIIKWLNPDGILLASIPNIREYKTVLKILLRGTFTYQEGGVMDKTHLRFFCKKNIIELMNGRSQLAIKKIKTNLDYPVAGTKTRSLINKLSLHMIEQFLAKQYFILSQKN